MYTKQVELNNIPKTLNEALRSHWTVYSRESKKIESELWALLRNYMPEAPIKKSKITIWRHSSGKLDRDNKFFTSKHILDSLVKLNVLENDTEENIVSLDVNQVKIKRGEQRKLVVRIEEVANYGEAK